MAIRVMARLWAVGLRWRWVPVGRSFLDVVAIAGVVESELGYTPNRTELELDAEAALRALADAGIAKEEVDGILSMGNGRMLRQVSITTRH
jgi:hypothetical protein